MRCYTVTKLPWSKGIWNRDRSIWNIGRSIQIGLRVSQNTAYKVWTCSDERRGYRRHAVRNKGAAEAWSHRGVSLECGTSA